MKIDIFTKAMGCQKLTYQNFSFLEVIHPKKRVSAEKKRLKDYVGNYIYENNVLQFFNHAEGYTTPDGSGGFNYVYQYLDHLGNVRISYSDNVLKNGIIGQNEIIEENNYYPFGLEHKGYNNVVVSENKFMTFNGQELNESLGLNVVEMDFRQYDPALGRFMAIDRLSEFSMSITPYRFGFNNPIIFSDPTGLYEVGEDGSYTITDPEEVAAFKKYLGGNQHASVQELMEHMVVSDDFAEMLPEIELVVDNKDCESGFLNSLGSQVQNSLNKISSKRTSWDINMNNNNIHQDIDGVQGIGVSLEMAYPKPIIGSVYGFGLDFGILGDVNGTAPYATTKYTGEPGFSFSISIEFFKSVKAQSNPNFINRNNLRGSGYESSFGIGPIGGAYGSDNGADYNINSLYKTYSGSIGLGIDLGAVNWKTKTYVPGDKK